MKEKILVLVEDEKWMDMLSKMFIGMIGHDDELRQQKDYTHIKSKDFDVHIRIGKSQNTIGHNVDLVLDLIHNQSELSADCLQEIHNIALMPMMSMSKYRL